MSHHNRVAVVTGAGRGIGQAISTTLAERGASVVLVDMADPSETASKISGETLSITADVSHEDEWARIAAETVERFGQADIVINNAGIFELNPIEELDLLVWRKVMSVNLDAHFFSAKHFVPLMRKRQWGRFVSISSNSIGLAQQGMSAYMASKMGVLGFVRGLANDVGGDGITVNALLPSLTRTPGTAHAIDMAAPPVVAAQAIKRIAEPQDIVGAVAFLTSDDAAFMTGQSVVVDGGLYRSS
ncbi:SDR family oxidoreductase [Polymorphobacter sp. PAMC 29334]|uniref:SDR family NAD(P)-dependent oxidoreductase n=1 Tax=Polymorphobacter sp. PAMC 29334 TaxID=2862331 RepID=UPI001C665C08|nr:SDR family NAD(P)-dependent oxidoreductase [Polymorphobacter sp. PAMC 29334]QYE36350.1 SDR family oxidoreductase [Polymorphobacter sp. PAMC 29334]